MATVEITHADGSTDTIPGTTAPSDNEPNWSRQRELLSMRRVRINVYREDAQNANLEPKSDRVDFEGDTLRLVDIDKGGSVWRLTCYSYGWDANRTQPTLGGSVYEGTDKEILTDLINEVPGWAAGNIAELTGPLSFVFSHAHIHDAIRRVEKNVPGELLFRNGGTVDYVSRIGTDKSGSVELSASAGTIEGELKINDKGREMDGTHIRVLGVHEGEAQLFVNLVPQDDPQTYENEVRYNASTRWQDSSDTDWDSFENKDVTSQATLEREAETLADELADGNIEAEATTPDLSVDLGDTVQVVKPDAEIDRPMRIHRITERVSGATKQLKLLLSTRTRMRTGDADNLRSIRQFNKGFQGSSVAVNIGPVIDAAEPGDPLSYRARIPDLEFINTAEIFIRGESYRIDSRPVAHSHDVDIDIPDHDHDVSVTHPSHSHDVDIFTTSDSAASGAESAGAIDQIGLQSFASAEIDIPFISGDAGYAFITCLTSIPANAGDANIPTVTMENTDKNTVFYDEEVSEIPENASRFDVAVTSGDVEGDRVRIEVDDTTDNTSEIRLTVGAVVMGDHAHGINETETSNTALGTTQTETSDGGGAFFTTETTDTTTGVKPGIFTTADTPSNVDVDVNGTTVASNVGSGTFETVVDITGELNSDAWNDFSFTTDTLGRLQTVIYVEGYNQIGQQ